MAAITDSRLLARTSATPILFASLAVGFVISATARTLGGDAEQTVVAILALMALIGGVLATWSA